MSAKRKSSPPILHDAETPPEITGTWIPEADLYHGEKLVRRGRPKLAHPRQLLSLRLPPEVIARWQSTGPGWQTRMVEVLGKSSAQVTAVLVSNPVNRTLTPPRGVRARTRCSMPADQRLPLAR